MKRKASLLFGAKLVLSIALLAVVLDRIEPRTILQVLSQADPWLVFAWYALSPVVVSLSAWRWEILAPGVSFWTAFKYTWIGVFFGHVFPGAISGDVAKGVSLALKDDSARAGLAASIVAEKVIGLVALLLFFDIACAAVYLVYGNAYAELRHLAIAALALSVAGIVGGVVAIWLVLGLKKVTIADGSGYTARILQGLKATALFYGGRPALLGKAFGISVVIHLVNILATYLSLKALRVDSGIVFASVVYPVVSIIMIVPISISGIGVRDATLAVLFALFGLPAASGVALSWLALFAMVPNIIIGGGIQLWEMYRKR